MASREQLDDWVARWLQANKDSEAAGDWTHVAGQPGFEPACDPSPSDAHTVLCTPGETGFGADSDFVDWPVTDSTGSKLFNVCGVALKVVVTVTPPSAPPLVIGKAIGLNVRC